MRVLEDGCWETCHVHENIDSPCFWSEQPTCTEKCVCECLLVQHREESVSDSQSKFQMFPLVSGRQMWVEFVVGSRPCSERFFSGYSGFPLSSKTNISKFQLTLKSPERDEPIKYVFIFIYIGHQNSTPIYGVSILKSAILSGTFCQITQVRNIAQPWDVFDLSLFYNISISWLYLLNGKRFYFLLG